MSSNVLRTARRHLPAPQAGARGQRPVGGHCAPHRPTVGDVATGGMDIGRRRFLAGSIGLGLLGGMHRDVGSRGFAGQPDGQPYGHIKPATEPEPRHAHPRHTRCGRDHRRRRAWDEAGQAIRCASPAPAFWLSVIRIPPGPATWPIEWRTSPMHVRAWWRTYDGSSMIHRSTQWSSPRRTTGMPLRRCGPCRRASTCTWRSRPPTRWQRVPRSWRHGRDPVSSWRSVRSVARIQVSRRPSPTFTPVRSATSCWRGASPGSAARRSDPRCGAVGPGPWMRTCGSAPGRCGAPPGNVSTTTGTGSRSSATEVSATTACTAWMWPAGGLGLNGVGSEVLSLGGRLGPVDAGQTPNTALTVVSFGDVAVVHDLRGLPTRPVPGMDPSDEVTFVGVEGSIVVNRTGGRLVDGDGRTVRTYGADAGKVDPITRHIKGFLRAVREGDPSAVAVGLVEGVGAAAMCHGPAAAHASVAEGPGQVDQEEVAGRSRDAVRSGDATPCEGLLRPRPRALGRTENGLQRDPRDRGCRCSGMLPRRSTTELGSTCLCD